MGKGVIMNREILFKAKRKDNGKWVEGYYIYHIKRTICPLGDSVKSEDEQHVIMQDGFSDWNMPRNTVVYEIDPDTLCQFTGLTDKNGEKIWENDICDRKEKYPEIVTYNKGDWQLDYSYVFGKEMHTDACNLGFYVCERDCVEVIGNIFDNVDLLEAKQ